MLGNCLSDFAALVPPTRKKSSCKSVAQTNGLSEEEAVQLQASQST